MASMTCVRITAQVGSPQCHIRQAADLRPSRISVPITARASTFQGISLYTGTVGPSLLNKRRVVISAAFVVPALVETAVETVKSSGGFLYTLADSAVDSSADAVNSVVEAATSATGAAEGAAATFVKQSDWLSGLSDSLEGILKLMESGLSAVHVPYAYGFAIILLTLLVKIVTFPLTKKQVESTMAMQNLQPKLKSIQAKYAGDQERIQLETARLYKQAGVNPLAGCLPTLATLPVWIGLYRALSNVANEGILTEGFFWIPSLAGPTSIAARTSGSGTSWLFPFVDGHPPLGWSDTIAYLVLPVLLVVSQAVSMQLMQPPVTDPSQKNTQAILKFLPLMIGYFSLSVPSGLSVYWLTNNLLSTAQQVYLKRLGGAQPIVGTDGAGIIDAGQAKRSGLSIATDEEKERERLRGERFKQLKAAEAEKKNAARRAAEEASRAAAAQAQEQLLEQQKALARVSEQNDEDDGDDEGEGEGGDGDLQVPEVAPSKVGTNGNGSAAGSRSRRARSKRSRKAA